MDRKEIWSTPEIGSNGGAHAPSDDDCIMVKASSGVDPGETLSPPLIYSGWHSFRCL